MKRSLALLLVLAGCSTTQWEKPGATQASVDADLRACTTEANTIPSAPAPRTTSSAIEVRTTRTGAGSVQTPAGSYGDADTQLQEAQRVQSCMRQKGYTLRSS